MSNLSVLDVLITCKPKIKVKVTNNLENSQIKNSESKKVITRSSCRNKDQNDIECYSQYFIVSIYETKARSS